MDMYGGSLSNPPPPDHCLRIDDFLDFSNLPPPQHSFPGDSDFFANFPSVPSDEAAELEWLSQFIDDTTTSFHNFPPSNHTVPIGSLTTSFLANNDANTDQNSTTKSSDHVIPSPSSSVAGKSRSKREANGGSPSGEGGVRRCSHCASEKTPQWRTGPLGPKTLCNACGVRFKSGRLVPEYRPAASPTFVLTQHSNSHRKVMELRRQKELLRHQQQQPQQQQQEEQCYRHKHDFQVC